MRDIPINIYDNNEIESIELIMRVSYFKFESF